MLERTISLASNNIINLELFTYSELVEIMEFLSQHYSQDKLLFVDQSRLFETIEFADLNLVIVNNTITFILKIPILHPTMYQYSKLYPVPNNEQIVLLLPDQYHLSSNQTEKWSKACKSIHKTSICKEVKDSECYLRNSQNCTYAKILNEHNVYIILNNHQLLLTTVKPTEVIENCNDVLIRKTLQGNYILQSSCKVIIGSETITLSKQEFNISYPNVNVTRLVPSRTINFNSQHMQDIELLQREAQMLQTPVNLHPLHYVNSSFTGLITIVLIVCIIVLLKYRKLLYSKLCKSRPIIKVDMNQLQRNQQEKILEEIQLHSTLNEDIQKS